MINLKTFLDNLGFNGGEGNGIVITQLDRFKAAFQSIEDAINNIAPAPPGSGEFRGVLLTKSTTQSITSGLASAVIWDNIIYDNVNVFNPAFPTLITIPPELDNEIMRVAANVEFATSNDNGKRGVFFIRTVNNTLAGQAATLIRHNNAAGTLSSEVLLNAAGVQIATANDQFQVNVLQDRGTPLDIMPGATTFLSIQFLGPLAT